MYRCSDTRGGEERSDVGLSAETKYGSRDETRVNRHFLTLDISGGRHQLDGVLQHCALTDSRVQPYSADKIRPGNAIR